MARNNQEMYEAITQKIVTMLEQGNIPWHKPWTIDSNGNPNLPANFKTRKAYRGINIWLLSVNQYSSPYWLTFKQLLDMGGRLKEGQKGTEIFFYDVVKKTARDSEGNAMINENGEVVKTSFPLLKNFWVFNSEQTIGLPERKSNLIAIPEKKFSTIDACENIINNFANRPSVSFGGDRACYSPSFDSITMPRLEQFTNAEGFYATYFHELTHSTGHANRLKRDGIVKFNGFSSHQYSEEELVAEMGASYLTAISGIQNSEILENSAAYLENWLSAIKSDVSLLMKAAGKAQKASDMILGIEFKAVA
jgi:antirestriction protein ArdC